MFLGDRSIADACIQLELRDAVITVKIAFGTILGDEEAIHFMTHIKGASGILPCGLLCNVVNKQRSEDIANGLRSPGTFYLCMPCALAQR